MKLRPYLLITIGEQLTPLKTADWFADGDGVDCRRSRRGRDLSYSRGYGKVAGLARLAAECLAPHGRNGVVWSSLLRRVGS